MKWKKESQVVSDQGWESWSIRLFLSRFSLPNLHSERLSSAKLLRNIPEVRPSCDRLWFAATIQLHQSNLLQDSRSIFKYSCQDWRYQAIKDVCRSRHYLQPLVPSETFKPVPIPLFLLADFSTFLPYFLHVSRMTPP